MVTMRSTGTVLGTQAREGPGIEFQLRARRTGLSPEAWNSLLCRGRAP